jgi:ABC-type Mn2+/Zn2+ transport system permease subunit
MSVAANTVASTSPPWRFQWSQFGLLTAYVLISALTAGLWLIRLAGYASSDLAAPLWTMLVGGICNASCAILGCYLVLRRMSLLGDAITHSVLPGIALAYYFSGSVSGWPVFVGALVLGIVTSALTHAVSSLGRVSQDASLGIVFTSLFALGVILINSWAGVDLDPGCVLYGMIETVAVDMTTVLGFEFSRPLMVLFPTLLLTLAFVAVFWKELKIVAFDPALAAAMGIRVTFLNYAFLTMVAVVAVASFESVGSVLVVAMLIVPPATAALMTDRLVWMLAWSVAIGATSAVFGYLMAAALNTNVAGAMAVAAGLQFAAAVFFAPRSGLVSRWLRNQSLAVRIAAEDILATLYRAEEKGAGSQVLAIGSPQASGNRQHPDSARSGLVLRLARRRLRRAGWVRGTSPAALALTDSGRAAARSLVRAHRLWESYLDAHFDLPRDHLHDAAERMEHYLGAELQAELAAELSDRAVDPHGKAIPDAAPPSEKP